MSLKFTDLPLEDRIMVSYTEKTPEWVYQLLEKHCNASPEKIRSMYKVTLDNSRKSINISGDPAPIYYLFNHLIKFDLKFESITTTNLRIDKSHFVNTII